MENVLISACLLGIGTRYDGKRVKKIDVVPYLDRYNFIPVCPEVFGGLPTPRNPSERVGERVIMKDGTDVSEKFLRGAEEAYRLCVLFNCKVALLKERSPSCGKGKIYDGTFSATLTDGDGVTAQYLMERGIRVVGESEFEDFLADR